MTQAISELIDGAAAEAVPVVRGIGDDELDLPTPCADYTVRDLLNHLFQVVTNFQALAAKQPADFATTPDYLKGDWRGRFAEETAKLGAAWAAPDAEQGVSAGMGLPSRIVGSMALLDVTVHAWDLARATGRDYAPDEQGIEPLYTLVDTMSATAREMNVFGEPVAVPADASRFDGLLAATGRDPHWRRERSAG
ncbi:TIGR03086 family metal-binding protein [Streptomyces sp. SID3343]|uniref:TIGR03086 family metal-binding protein n=1 Tax=Streptomyces sp. SID3343 TaxID=2690260 RepID=UPI001370EAC3|nr:TIGR03086 family metal-binding protein [Streptomyces sp. SID3343]MYW02783.1 TIGR03086 family protein [Streptomyces sp. SID3343]